MSTARAAAALALAATMGSCHAVPLGDGPRRVVVHDVGALVIVPTYDDFADGAAALGVAVHALTDAPDASRLAAAQAAWRAARAPWMESQAFRFGPVKDRVLDAAIDQSPVDLATIEAEIAGSTPIDGAYVAALGANKKGFHAIEHLLFAPGALAALSADPRRRAFLGALSDDLAARAAELRDAWAPEAEDYLTRFADVGGEGASFATIKQAIDGLVNETVFLSEQVTDAKLGKPLGLDAGGVPHPELEESGPSDNSLADIAANLRGLRAIWLGTRAGGVASGASGLRSLIAARSPATAARVDRELAAAEAAIAAVPRPFAASLTNGAPEVMLAWDAVHELRITLATDVVALLGATLAFNDNDGD